MLAMLALVEEEWAAASHPEVVARAGEAHGISLRSANLRFQRCGVAGENLHPVLAEILVPALANGSVELARES
jgi:hypothetical protein